MTALLYYSYSKSLTEDEIVEIDQKVLRNRELVCRFMTKLSSNTKRKTKRVIIVVCFGFVLVFSNIQSVKAIGLSLPPKPVVKVQPNYKHTYEMKVAPTINPRLDKILMLSTNTNRMIPLIYLNGHYCYINDHLLKKLRAGNDLHVTLTVVTIGVVVYLMCQLSGVDAFAILQELGKFNSPTPNPGFGLAPTSTSTQLSVTPTKAQEFNDMSLMFNEPKTKFSFVMTQNEALKLISETYPGQLEITDNKRFSDWQAAKKIYHAIDFGVNPEDYGMTKSNIMRLNSVGLTKYVREGRPLPPIKLVKDYQMAVKNMYDHAEHFDGKYSSRGEQKIHETSYSYNKTTRQVAGFNKETGDIITAGKYSPRAFDRFMDTKNLGQL